MKHVKRNRKRNARKLIILLMVACAYVLYTQPVLAAGTGAQVISQGFQNLMDIVTALVSAIGAIILLWGFFEWGVSLQSQDGVMQSSAFKRIGGGVVMVLAPQLINAFISIP